ncbi:hypothetical protein G3I40_15935 [Streptomyces sp. SID14478]|uniref:hypothetical protein n=1 Tax=Streptomyces sp. SID14478 TaxID=2706073 RepID=UPI0013D9C698|nr:hypothetical protein [Streptomyces sp. SID14478]NEB76700.1 hypothetical protein [Streptomyces sp. SID14478]
MINHTMIVSFQSDVPDTEIDSFLHDIEKVMLDSGHVQTFTAQRHIPVPGEEAIPALIATVIVQLGLTDFDALVASFAAPGAGEVIHRWQARFPYKVAWANHEVLA